MNVIEALTVPGDSKLDLRLLAEKMGRLREVRELLEEERALAAVYIKTTATGGSAPRRRSVLPTSADRRATG